MRARLEPGDCLDVLFDLAMAGEQFDSCITDPPYHLTSVTDRFGKEGSAPAQFGRDGLYARQSAGFMGKQWDGGDIALRPETWRAVWETLKPGAFLLAFGGTRTFHRQTCAIEDAGFEIRDCLMWLYGTGFPKSHDVAKGIDKALGATRTEVVRTWKPTGTARLVGGQGAATAGRGSTDEWETREEIQVLAPATPEAAAWQGWGTALKPAWEPIVVARKPLIGTVAANVLARGTGALNIDASRIPAEKPTGWAGAAAGGGSWNAETCGLAKPGDARPVEGRWPANVLHDGSDEVLAAFATYGEKGAAAPVRGTEPSAAARNTFGERARVPGVFHGDAGSAARFFYSAKAGKADRAGSAHPTVKPLALMRYLAKLVTPPGGVILDPFSGSGTTLQAAIECGFGAVAIEREPEYQADIRRRIAALEAEADALFG